MTGNPGTGKTSLARKLGEVMWAMGLLPKSTVHEIAPADVKGQHVGHAEKLMNEAVDHAIGQILFIDEAYGFAGDVYGKKAAEVLMKRMTDDEGKFLVIAAGYKDEMEGDFLRLNPGFARRFEEDMRIHIDDYCPDELTEIFVQKAIKDGYALATGTREAVKRAFEHMYAGRTKTFGNAGEAVNLLKATIRRVGDRVAVQGGEMKPVIAPEDVAYKFADTKSVEEVLSELDEFVGMRNVKDKVRSIVASLKVKKAAAAQTGINKPLLDFHILMTGNPGTGKTALARKLGEVICAMGLLPKSTVHEISPADVKGQYVGESEKLMNRAVDQAMGQILFVDEAYGFAGDVYGKKAAEVLMKRMTDDEGKFLVIAAGYKEKMEKDFLRLNAGLARRFEDDMRIHIDDYRPDELTEIFKQKAIKDGYSLAEGTTPVLNRVFEEIYTNRTKTFGNAGEAVNLLKAAIRRVGNRVTEPGDNPTLILPEDIEGCKYTHRERA
jgi:SpoVK/Ycf46/Vps4 family AAA+-type ATPase